ncbi:hypothetical protein F4775DRAFT_538681 [Biscogniauxia sp. FL1348]|nr:hypothetical protein F4775DRAFT_538681 [Biscogniauxia sp. FL1348]
MEFQDTFADGFFRRALQYEFTTEMAPGVWKIYRKKDRMDYLAHDMTDQLFTATEKPGVVAQTPVNTLLSPRGHNLIEPLLRILNHENLVSLVDVIATQVSQSGKLGRSRWYTVWNYCDAGNLGNLLVPEEWRPPLPGKKEGVSDNDPSPELEELMTTLDEDIAKYWGEDVYPDASYYNKLGKKISPNRKFLPESLCWHVLCSVLKGLAWLHDGALRIVEDPDTGRMEMDYVDLEWQAMLHRNINPENIFLGHPRRDEWYGACKLGNYSNLVITGFAPGDEGTPLQPDLLFSKPIAPALGKKFTPLVDLIQEDTRVGATYPYQPGQPYTMVSEYRALGEILQAMMVPPGSYDHIENIRKYWVIDNLRNADYSSTLKDFVMVLMQADPWKDPKGDAGLGRAYTTSTLCLDAWWKFTLWKRSDPEGKRWFTGEAAARSQREMDRIEKSIVPASVVQMQRVMNEMDPSKLTPPSKQI